MLFNITTILAAQDGFTISNTLLLILALLSYLTMYPIMPRFIISVRELHDRDLRGRWQGIDTGFGVLSQPHISQNADMSAIEFADVTLGQDEVVEVDANESGAIRLETLGDNVDQI